MTRGKLLKIFRQTNALQRGHFELASGAHSGHYFQCALFLQHPHVASQVCRALAQRFAPFKPTAVIGLAVGGIIVAHEVARHLRVRAIFTERINGGRMQLRRSFQVGPVDRVVIIEDVVTTGKSAREVVRLAQQQKARVVGVGSIVDRSGGKARFGQLPFASLMPLQLESFRRDRCPLCHEGWPLTKPGTKGLALAP